MVELRPTVSTDSSSLPLATNTVSTWLSDRYERADGPRSHHRVNRIATPSPKPGQIRLWTYQSIAHGADAVLYFRWRTATKGTEIYWHGINDYDNRSNRRVAEVGCVGAELAMIGERVAGSAYQADVAIVQDYDNT